MDDALKKYEYYRDDSAVIYCGDCREVLPMIEPVDLVLTDPPYGINENSRKQQSRKSLARPADYGHFDWDKAPPAVDVLLLIVAKAQHSIFWGGNFFGLPAASKWLVWDKDNSGDFADCELAWTNLPGAVRKFKWRWNGMLQEDMKRKEVRLHPTQKPLSLMKWCIQQSGDVKTILDPFMGSGTTLVAARYLGLRAIGIELNEKYCAIAAERLRQKAFDFTPTPEGGHADNSCLPFLS